MKASKLALGFTLLLAAAVGTSVAYSQSQPAGRGGWEYVLIEWNDVGEAGMKRLGEQGRELVTVDTEPESLGPESGGGSREFHSKTYFYFKRPK